MYNFFYTFDKKKAPNENRTRYLQFTRLVPHHYGPGSLNVLNQIDSYLL